jgi:hypothetical protein
MLLQYCHSVLPLPLPLRLRSFMGSYSLQCNYTVLGHKGSAGSVWDLPPAAPIHLEEVPLLQYRECVLRRVYKKCDYPTTEFCIRRNDLVVSSYLRRKHWKLNLNLSHVLKIERRKDIQIKFFICWLTYTELRTKLLIFYFSPNLSLRHFHLRTFIMHTLF